MLRVILNANTTNIINKVKGKIYYTYRVIDFTLDLYIHEGYDLLMNG